MNFNFLAVRYIALFALVLTFFNSSKAQHPSNIDSLLIEAQRLAKIQNYAAARTQAKTVLKNAPSYTDAYVLIGYTYAWENAYDSARQVLIPLLNTSSPDVLLALSSIELWAGNPLVALQYAHSGIVKAPTSIEFVSAKASALRDLKRYEEASSFIDSSLIRFPNDETLLKLEQQINALKSRSYVRLGYQLTTFDQAISNWQLGTFQYSKQLTRSTLSGELSYAKRLEKNAVQAEIDFWPRFNKKTYAYLNIGLSNNELFPRFRTGAEFYRLLPNQFETSVGMRTLFFKGETVWLYTGHIGKYFNNYWTSFRPFLQQQNNSWQATGLVQLRRYFRNSDEYLNLSVSKGSTPMEQIGVQEINRLDASQVGLQGQFLLGQEFILGGSVMFGKEEYIKDKSRSRITTGLSLQHKF